MPSATPSLVWLASVDDASLRSDIGIAALTLQAVRKGDLPTDDVYWPKAVRRVLVACVEAGPGQFTRIDALKLLYPLALVLSQLDQIDEFAPELRALSHRNDVWESSALDVVRRRLSIIGPGGPSFLTRDNSPIVEYPSVSGNQIVGARAGCMELPISSDSASAADVGSTLGLLASASQDWLDRREALPGDDRAAGDIRLIHEMTASKVLIPPAFAEALFVDDQMWDTRAAADYAQELIRPFQQDVVGLAASVLLNSRIRRLRPRLFLRFPETFVAERIGQRSDDSQLRRDVLDLVAEPFLRTAEVIDAELKRPKGRLPRKNSFKVIRDHLSQVLQSLGYRWVGAGGDIVPFDPAMHVSFQPVDAQSDVVIMRPGLQELSSGTISVKAQVNPPATVAVPTEQNGAEQRD
ncbi:MAG: hypothetical protein DLM70_01385 [Chloroflexi bacterium]|nr:MAG: hypothetical protein DLM70_01385 [Chloroflexota bacterium]